MSKVSGRSGRTLLLGLAMMLGAAVPGRAGSISFTTFLGSAPVGSAVAGFTWNLSGNHADPRLGATYGGASAACIGSCTSPSTALGAYAGYEFFYFDFTLPAGATNIALTFDHFNADDRAVLGVNGVEIGGFKVANWLPPGGITINTMKDASGVNQVTFTPGHIFTITDQSLFQAGANFFSAWVNNTGQGASGIPPFVNDPNVPATGRSAGNPSSLVTRGSITWDETAAVPVPEPATFLLVGAGIAVAWKHRRVKPGHQARR